MRPRRTSFRQSGRRLVAVLVFFVFIKFVSNNSMKVFFQELKNRRVFRVAIAYAIVASGSIQVIGTVLPIFHVRDWIQQVFMLLIALGFPVALMLAWAFDITAGGIVRTPNAAGEFAVNRRR